MAAALGAFFLLRSNCGSDCDQRVNATGENAPAPVALNRLVDQQGQRQTLSITLEQAANVTTTSAPSTSTSSSTTSSSTTSSSTTSTTAKATTTTASKATTTTASKGTTTTAAKTTTTTAPTTSSAKTEAAETRSAPSSTSTTQGTTTTTGQTTTTAPTSTTDGGSGGGGGSGDGSGTTTSSTAPAPAAPPPPSGSSTPAKGPAVYINPNSGNDANNGSEGSPLRSLQTALSRAQPGQRILLMSGDYRELQSPSHHHYYIDHSGTPDNWIKIEAAPGQRPVIHANRGSGLLITGRYVEVSGIEVRGEGFSPDNSWGVGLSVSQTHHVRLLNNTVSGMPVGGINANDSSNVQIINNVVYNNSYWSDLNGSGISFFEQRNHGQGADAGGYHDLVIGNRVFHNENKVNSKWQKAKGLNIITDGNGIIIDSNRDSGYSGRTLIANNLVYDNGGRGIISYNSNRVDIIHNTTYQNARTSNLIEDYYGKNAPEIGAGKGSEIRIINNVAWSRPGRTDLLIDGASVESYGNVFVTDSPTGHTSSNDRVTSSNPGLRNPSTSGGDFRPTSGGPLEGTVSSPGGYASTDATGTSRSGSTEPGAFESSASSGR